MFERRSASSVSLGKLLVTMLSDTQELPQTLDSNQLDPLLLAEEASLEDMGIELLAWLTFYNENSTDTTMMELMELTPAWEEALFLADQPLVHSNAADVGTPFDWLSEYNLGFTDGYNAAMQNLPQTGRERVGTSFVTSGPRTSSEHMSTSSDTSEPSPGSECVDMFSATSELSTIAEPIGTSSASPGSSTSSEHIGTSSATIFARGDRPFASPEPSTAPEHNGTSSATSEPFSGSERTDKLFASTGSSSRPLDFCRNQQEALSSMHLGRSVIDLTQDDTDVGDASLAKGRRVPKVSTVASARRTGKPTKRRHAKRLQRRMVTAEVSKVCLDGRSLVWEPHPRDTDCREQGVWVSRDGQETYEWGELLLCLEQLSVEVIPNLSPVTYRAKWKDRSFEGVDPFMEFTVRIPKSTLTAMLRGGMSRVDVILLA